VTAVAVAKVVFATDLKRDLERAHPDALVSVVEQPLPTEPCEVSDHCDERPGVVKVFWMPRGGTAFEQWLVCAECGPSYLRLFSGDYEGKIYVEIGAWST
jgi:hypothetical protein